MPLIQCHDCSAQVSDKAMACPGCGRPLPSVSDDHIGAIAKHGAFRRSRWASGALFWSGVLWLAVPILTGADSTAVAEKWPLAKWMLGIGAGWYLLAEIERNLHERRARKAASLKQ